MKKKHSNGGNPPQRARPALERGVAINGELRVQLFGLNLLPIQVRLLVSSKDVAEAVGLDWWNDSEARRRVAKRAAKSPAVRRERNERRQGTLGNGSRPHS